MINYKMKTGSIGVSHSPYNKCVILQVIDEDGSARVEMSSEQAIYVMEQIKERLEHLDEQEVLENEMNSV